MTPMTIVVPEVGLQHDQRDRHARRRPSASTTSDSRAARPRRHASRPAASAAPTTARPWRTPTAASEKPPGSRIHECEPLMVLPIPRREHRDQPEDRQRRTPRRVRAQRPVVEQRGHRAERQPEHDVDEVLAQERVRVEPDVDLALPGRRPHQQRAHDAAARPTASSRTQSSRRSTESRSTTARAERAPRRAYVDVLARSPVVMAHRPAGARARTSRRPAAGAAALPASPDPPARRTPATRRRRRRRGRRRPSAAASPAAGSGRPAW